MDEQLIRLWGSVLTDVATTYVHNLTHAPGKPARFERAAVNDRIDARALAEFRCCWRRKARPFWKSWMRGSRRTSSTKKTQRPAGKPFALAPAPYHVQDE